MAATVIDGKKFAQNMRAEIAKQVAQLSQEHQLIPGLAVVLVGEDPASSVYVANKARFTKEAGMHSWEHKLPVSTSQKSLLALIERLNQDLQVHGILVQLPLPEHINTEMVIDSIDPQKDVDGFHVENAGRLSVGLPSLVPCTPMGVVLLLRHYVGSLVSKHALVIGKSNIVGKPMLQLLMREQATVTVANSKTLNTEELARQADIIIVAAGRPELLKGHWIKPGATIIDVGINRVDAPERGEGKVKLVGDVAYQSASEVAGLITPVPGGVGPMTIACLLRNTVKAAAVQHGISDMYN